MTQLIMDHGVSECFGTRLAPNPEGFPPCLPVYLAIILTC
jgi:hypothetical protein